MPFLLDLILLFFLKPSIMSKNALICDDHVLFGEGIRNILQIKGFEATMTTNPEECLRALKNQKYDVFLCDLNIHEYNGFEILQLATFAIRTWIV